METMETMKTAQKTMETIETRDRRHKREKSGGTSEPKVGAQAMQRPILGSWNSHWIVEIASLIGASFPASWAEAQKHRMGPVR